MCEGAYQITTAKVDVFSDSVFCMGEMRSDPNAARMSKSKWHSQNNHLKELNGIELGILEEIQNFLKRIQCELEHFRQDHLHVNVYEDIV